MRDIRFFLSRWGMCRRSGGQGGTGGWFDVVGGWRRGWLRGLSAGAGELEGHVHKLLPVCRGLIEKAGEGTGPLICGPHGPPLWPSGLHSFNYAPVSLSVTADFKYVNYSLVPGVVKCFPPLYSDTLFVFFWHQDVMKLPQWLRLYILFCDHVGTYRTLIKGKDTNSFSHTSLDNHEAWSERTGFIKGEQKMA